MASRDGIIIIIELCALYLVDHYFKIVKMDNVCKVEIDFLKNQVFNIFFFNLCFLENKTVSSQEYFYLFIYFHVTPFLSRFYHLKVS